MQKSLIDNPAPLRSGAQHSAADLAKWAEESAGFAQTIRRLKQELGRTAPGQSRSLSRMASDLPRERTSSEPFRSVSVESINAPSSTTMTLGRAQRVLRDHQEFPDTAETFHGSRAYQQAYDIVHPRWRSRGGEHNPEWARSVRNAHGRGHSMPRAVLDEARGRGAPRAPQAPQHGFGMAQYVQQMQGYNPFAAVHNPFAHNPYAGINPVAGAHPLNQVNAAHVQQMAQVEQFIAHFESTPTINVSPQQVFHTGGMPGVTHARRIKLQSGWITIDGRTAQISSSFIVKRNSSDIDQINAFLKTYFPLGATINGQKYNTTSLLTAVRIRLPGLVAVTA